MKKLWIRSGKPIPKAGVRRIYEGVIPTIKRVARRCGYAAAVHGSLTRDCDILAVPWVKTAVLPITLAHRIHKVIAKYHLSPSGFRKQGSGNKPHGREAYVLYFGCHGSNNTKPSALYVDLSVMPPKRGK